ncbi:hypothetical protein GGR51DRAFT_560451 [Nemania sp. FL0031]|nr:hypothetical protein GGR51DRAFT_560451 [Nemania sp. FL0031]
MSGYNQVPEGQVSSGSVIASDGVADALRGLPQPIAAPHTYQAASPAAHSTLSVHGPRNNGLADMEPQAQRREPALAFVNEPQGQVPAFSPQVPYVLGFPQPTLFCTVLGCQHVFSHQEDLYLHTREFHAMPQGAALYQPGTGYPNALPMNNTVSHEIGHYQGQVMNYYPIGGFIPGGGYSMNAAGQQGNEHQQFGNYEPAEDPFQHDDYMNWFGDQAGDFQQPGGPSHGNGF